ncbi:hypothetical protein BIW11_10234 [Tropilaelaps mercedesae]|uniref:SAM domain-containing protein n=1 Tax=Tropilaelaps mercedesae TaxID=418985 RepID=A0A1V9XGL0_9ACAR|nr:hypothetical protein BIW11_10234 [Tropilaelaps mercedesae]
MPTISRMTPEDLTAIGVTKPAHRRRLFAEISKLNISDGIPDYKPDSLSLLLKLLRLEEYEATLVSQGYDSVDKVAELTWEDIDDIGITKLGHQKKLTLAIKKIKNFPRFQPAFRPLPPSSSSHHSLARHSSIDLGNPHARPITVPVPPEQFESAAWTPAPLQHSVSQTDSFTLPHHRQGHEFNRHMGAQLADEQLYFAWQQQQELQQQDNIFAQQSALRGRSLESLEHNFEWYDMVNSWRNQMLADGSGNGSQYIEGTSTLQRPRGLLGHKSTPRPVAKVQGTSTVSIRDQITTNAGGCCAPGQELGDATDEAAKSELLAGQGPVPPKRGGLIPSGVTKAHDVGDAAFATCVQSLTSRFTLDTCEGGEVVEGTDALTLSLAARNDAHAMALARTQLSSANSAHVPRPPPPPEPPAAAGGATNAGSGGGYRQPRSPQRERSPVPPGDSTVLAPQVIELNQAMQSELKMKLKQRNHQAIGNKPAPAQDQQLKELSKPAKSDADLEREKFLAKLESVRKKSERKDAGHHPNGRSPLLARKGLDKDRAVEPGNRTKGLKDEGKEPAAKGDAKKEPPMDASQLSASNTKRDSLSSNPIEKEIRSLQECMASVMDPKAGSSASAESVEDDANDYDTNPFTALLSKIEKNVDKEFLERKRNEKAANADPVSSAKSNKSTNHTGSASAATPTQAPSRATTVSAVAPSTASASKTTNAHTSSSGSNGTRVTSTASDPPASTGPVIETGFKRLSRGGHPHHQVEPAAPAMEIRPIEVKLESGFSSSSTINNLNRPYEIARSTKTEPMITQNKFFSTIGVETKVINLEDRPHRKSDAGLPSTRAMANSHGGALSNNSGDNQRRTSVDGSRMGLPNTVGSIISAASAGNQQHSSAINGANRIHGQTAQPQAKAGSTGKSAQTPVVGVNPDTAQQLQAAQAEFDNKFGNLNNVSKESEKDKRIMDVQEVQEALEHQAEENLREGLVSSARKIFEVCGGPKTSPGTSASASPAIPRRSSVKRDEPPAPPPRPQRPPGVPPRNPSTTTTVRDSSGGQDAHPGASPARQPPKNQRRVPETPKVIQDIEHMLSSLTDQLDAMLN